MSLLHRKMFQVSTSENYDFHLKRGVRFDRRRLQTIADYGRKLFIKYYAIANDRKFSYDCKRSWTIVKESDLVFLHNFLTAELLSSSYYGRASFDRTIEKHWFSYDWQSQEVEDDLYSLRSSANTIAGSHQARGRKDDRFHWRSNNFLLFVIT